MSEELINRIRGIEKRVGRLESWETPLHSFELQYDPSLTSRVFSASAVVAMLASRPIDAKVYLVKAVWRYSLASADVNNKWTIDLKRQDSTGATPTIATQVYTAAAANGALTTLPLNVEVSLTDANQFHIDITKTLAPGNLGMAPVVIWYRIV